MWALAGTGQLEQLKSALADGCPLDISACSMAAAGGHLPTLRYLRANGCPWDKWVCDDAARGGHLELLKVRAAAETPRKRPGAHGRPR